MAGVVRYTGGQCTGYSATTAATLANGNAHGLAHAHHYAYTADLAHGPALDAAANGDFCADCFSDAGGRAYTHALAAVSAA